METVGTYKELSGNKMGFTEMLSSADETSKTDDEKEVDNTQLRRVSKVSLLLENGCRKLSCLSIEKVNIQKCIEDIFLT